MNKRIFISYSHKDEDLRIDLEDHLSILQRKKLISIWHDRKIIGGQEWKGKIDENLENAEIVIFLISPSFLASDYCYDIEVQKALENQSAGKCEILSIIIRPCDWLDCEFAKFQVAPKDANPITKWENKDDAWLDSVNILKELLNNFKPENKLDKNKSSNDHSYICSNFEQWLNDTEITLTHRKVNKVHLSDIFVTPDIEFKENDITSDINIKSLQSIINKPSNYLISGEEQQGKTSALKYIYKEFLKKEITPIYLDAKSIKKSSLDIVLKENIGKQYESLDYTTYINIQKKAILIDNLDNISLNTKHRNIFLEEINKNFDIIIITFHDTYSYIYNEISELDEFQLTQLLGLGHKNREELAKKWLSLGQEESISDTELYDQCDEVKSRLNLIIKRNIVPPKPVYVLMLLQMFEANTQLNTDLTSHGHCYQQLIYQTFENAKIKPIEFEKYLNVLSELAWWILDNQTNPNSYQIDIFFQEYCDKFLEVDKSEVLDKLLSHSILEENDFRVGFKYPYIYYFFAGKKIADSYRDFENVRSRTKELLENLHREDFANILIFITHHTKDLWVLEEINKVLSSLFSENKPATLDKIQLSFMEDFIKSIPKLVMEQREIHTERQLHNERLDTIERTSPDEKNIESHDILANINQTFKGMEISGQIVRNRHASLTKGSLLELTSSGINSGLRFLEYFISISDTAKNEIIKFISSHLSEQPSLTDQQLKRNAETAYMHLTYGIINGAIRKIASSMGSIEAKSIYEEIEKNAQENNPALTLIRQSIDLQFNKSLNLENISKTLSVIRGNVVCTQILKEMVIQHTYMFPVDYRIKQKLSSLLNISVQGQRFMDQQKQGKG